MLCQGVNIITGAVNMIEGAVNIYYHGAVDIMCCECYYGS